MAQIKVLIIASDEATQGALSRLVNAEPGLETAGSVSNIEDVDSEAHRLRPDVCLIDLPEELSFSIVDNLSRHHPLLIVVVVTSGVTPENTRKLLHAGAHDLLPKPLEKDAVTLAIRNSYQREWQRRARQGIARPESEMAKGKVILVFGSKGGVGRTTIAVNLAAGLQVHLKQRTSIIDLDLQFGDVAVMLDSPPKQTISHLVRGMPKAEAIERSHVDRVLLQHSSGIRLLLAPSHPEEAELVTAAHVKVVINILKKEFDYIVVDGPSFFHEPTLAAMDIADHIVLLAATDVPTLKNVKLSLDVILKLGHPKEKVKLVINRASTSVGFETGAVEKHLGIPIFCRVRSDGRTAVAAVNKGTPFMIGDCKSYIAKDVMNLARSLLEVDTKDSFPREVVDEDSITRNRLHLGFPLVKRKTVAKD